MKITINIDQCIARGECDHEPTFDEIKKELSKHGYHAHNEYWFYSYITKSYCFGCNIINALKCS